MTNLVTQDAIAKSLSSLQFKVNSKADAIEFLKSNDVNKSNVERFLAWMIHFDAIPEDSSLWPQTFYQLIIAYKGRLDFYSQSCLDEKATTAIVNDVKRALTWFNVLATMFGFDSSIVSCDCITRVICFLMRETPQYNYLQGYDRYAIISYLVSLSFCEKLQIGNIATEAFAISLLRHIIQFSDTSQYLTTDASIQLYYSELELVLKQKNEKIMLALSKANITSLDFASPWVGVLFADIHKPFQLVLLWDHLIYHHNEFQPFFAQVVSAHLNQVPFNEDPYIMLGNIQNYKNWDIQKILEESESAINPPFITKTSITGILRFWL